MEDNGAKKCLLDHISFQVDDGEMLVITGPNGGGKSTLAKVLIGIEKAESGKIFLNGEDITNYDINHRANAGIGYAFQQPPRFKGMTVQRLLALAAGREMSDQECCKLLSDVGLCAEEYLNRQIDGTLSGGEMKRIEIATVLAKEHTLCIFDEPGSWNRSLELLHADPQVRGDPQGEKAEPDRDLPPGEDHQHGRPDHGDRRRKDQGGRPEGRCPAVPERS